MARRVLLGLLLLLGWGICMGDVHPNKVNILFVGAHPDDESTAFGTMARYVLDGGCKAAVITATRGEGGGNAVGREQGHALGIMRELEEREALRVIGISQVYYLDQLDGGFTVSAKTAEQAWGHEDLVERLVRYYRLLRPDVVITMNPWPTGHGHHQYIARLATEAFHEAAQSDVFPRQITDEGLTPWQPRKLYYALEYGDGGLSPDLKVDLSDTSKSRVVTYAAIKRRALRAYRTQGWDASDDGIPSTTGYEPFMRAFSFIPVAPGIETDLMGGILTSVLGAPVGLQISVVPQDYRATRGASSVLEVKIRNESDIGLKAVECQLETPWGTARRTVGDLGTGQAYHFTQGVEVPATAPSGPAALVAHVSWTGGQATVRCPIEVTPEVTAELAPTPALSDFREWAHRWGLDAMIHVVPAEVTLGSGQSGTIPVLVGNRGQKPLTVEVSAACQGITLPPAPRQVVVRPGETRTVPIPASVPPEIETGAFPLRAVVRAGEATEVSEGYAQVVPTLKVPMVAHGLTLDGNIDKYKPFKYHIIPFDRLWEGHTQGPQDLTGRFWVAHDDKNLYVAVDVVDDVVVSNIAPDDNKAHWRTDAVEIAIDPKGPGVSQTTLTTFKVGIIPFNTSQHAMAARDADASPGPIEKTAPGMRILSRRTTHGYLVEAVIPKSVALKGARTFGFNVMLYDNDKADARVGENAGHARTAWSAWKDVQGTPRLWGHAVLESAR
ncbi:MAG TPA: PIG-L family deacetylase [Candidatus Xenobia bacterium]|jgi:LmbE family N-acetylglucosaminyl deacetylase